MAKIIFKIKITKLDYLNLVWLFYYVINSKSSKLCLSGCNVTLLFIVYISVFKASSNLFSFFAILGRINPRPTKITGVKIFRVI